MTKQITVVGLDQIGTSIGLALAEYKDNIRRIGHDPDLKRMQQAEKVGAFDKTFSNLNVAVRDADIVILAIPTDLIKDALSIAASELKPDTLLINTSLVRSGVNDWIKQSLPKECHYISILPLIHADRLEDLNDDVHAPRADLFASSEIVIASDYNSSQKAVQMASDLVELLKASPFYADPAEADGIVAQAEQLPKLAAAALIHTLIDQPGWKDCRHFTSRAFYRSASVSHLWDEQEYFGISALLNKENVSRSLGYMIDSLQNIRDMVDNGKENDLKNYLKDARQGYESWIEQRKTGDWDAVKKEKPQISTNIFERLFGVSPKIKPSK